MSTHYAVSKRLHRSTVLQIGAVLFFWGLGTALAVASGAPLPGGILGLALLLALLLSRRLSALSLRRGTNWFLAEMLLFFVPAVLAVLGHREFFGLIGLKILAVILVSTISVMVSTALAVEACSRWMSRHA